jgi:hypothetical protein
MITILVLIFDVAAKLVQLYEAKHGEGRPTTAVAVVAGEGSLCEETTCSWCDDLRATCKANRLA